MSDPPPSFHYLFHSCTHTRPDGGDTTCSAGHGGATSRSVKSVVWRRAGPPNMLRHNLTTSASLSLPFSWSSCPLRPTRACRCRPLGPRARPPSVHGLHRHLLGAVLGRHRHFLVPWARSLLEPQSCSPFADDHCLCLMKSWLGPRLLPPIPAGCLLQVVVIRAAGVKEERGQHEIPAADKDGVGRSASFVAAQSKMHTTTPLVTPKMCHCLPWVHRRWC
jgi:hypothetical protein